MTPPSSNASSSMALTARMCDQWCRIQALAAHIQSAGCVRCVNRNHKGKIATRFFLCDSYLENIMYDAVVVGGGAMGMASAYAILRRGLKRVLVLEREMIGNDRAASSDTNGS